jgi:glycosyltransferase involved in cell wall biosynthesis
MKILIIIPSLGGGGAEKNAVVLANALCKVHEVTILTPYNVISKSNEILLETEVNYVPLNKKKVLYSLRTIFNFILKYKPDVVFSTVAYFSLLFSILIPFLPKKICYIYRETNIPSLYNESSTIIISKIFNILYKTTVNNFDRVICQSDDMKNDLLKISNLSEDKIFKINNPVIKNSPYNRKPIGNFVLAAGRLTEQKGFSDLILKYSNSCLRDNNIKLKIAGEGPCYKELAKLIFDLKLTDEVELLGFVDNITPYFDKALFFILSSRYEGFPNVVLESLSRGCPVLSSNCKGGINEIIRNGENGFIYDDFNFNSTAKKMLTENFSYYKISEDITKRFSYELIIEKYKEVIFI